MQANLTDNYTRTVDRVLADSAHLAGTVHTAGYSIENEAEQGRVREAAGPAVNMRRFRIHVSEDTGNVVVEILDPRSGKVVRQVPPEQVERVAVAMRQFLGHLLDRRI